MTSVTFEASGGALCFAHFFAIFSFRGKRPVDHGSAWRAKERGMRAEMQETALRPAKAEEETNVVGQGAGRSRGIGRSACV
jgi:hypothetical protein